MAMTPKYRLILSLSFILVASFLAISTLNFNSTRFTLRTEITEASLPLLRENIYSEIQSDFLPSLNIASAMANDSFLIDWILGGEKNLESITTYLNRICLEYDFVSAFYISSNTGNYYHNDGLLKTIDPDDNHDIWYYNFINTGKKYELDVDSDEAADNRLTIFINNRLEDDNGDLLGVTGIGIEMASFSRFLEAQQEKYRRRIYLVDLDGVVQAHSDSSLVEKTRITELTGITTLASGILGAGTEPYNGTYKDNNSQVLITSRLIPQIDWFVVVEQDESEALANARRDFRRTLIIGLVSSILVVLLTILTVNKYSIQLEAMATTDVLTGAANRRALEAALPRMLYRKDRFGRSVSLLVMDVDNFKDINDNLGHQTGDEILKSLTQIISNKLHPDDLLVRWGGDEFVIAVESAVARAVELAESIRKDFESSGRGATLSIGITEAVENDGLDSMIKRADSALYRSKAEGRNLTNVE